MARKVKKTKTTSATKKLTLAIAVVGRLNSGAIGAKTLTTRLK
jgi:hypothetical protein